MLSKKLWQYLFIVLSLSAIVIATYVNVEHFNTDGHAEAGSDRVNEVSVSSSSSTDAMETSFDETESSSEDEPVMIDETSSIYNTELLVNNGIERLNPANYASVDELIYALMEAYEVGVDQVGIAYYNYQTNESFYFNETRPMLAGSIYKVPLVAMYLDLIESGVYSFDTQVPFSEEYIVEGAGEVTNNEFRASYSIGELIYEAIVHSDNTASWTLLFNHFGNWGTFQTAALEFADYAPMSEEFYTDNYMTALQIENTLDTIINDSSYDYLIELMASSEPPQLFTSYVSEGMANKYGRFEGMVNDAGIFYQDGKPVYTLVAMTEDAVYADAFLEMLNLRVNEWYQYHS